MQDGAADDSVATDADEDEEVGCADGGEPHGPPHQVVEAAGGGDGHSDGATEAGDGDLSDGPCLDDMPVGESIDIRDLCDHSTPEHAKLGLLPLCRMQRRLLPGWQAYTFTFPFPDGPKARTFSWGRPELATYAGDTEEQAIHAGKQWLRDCTWAHEPDMTRLLARRGGGGMCAFAY